MKGMNLVALILTVSLIIVVANIAMLSNRNDMDQALAHQMNTPSISPESTLRTQATLMPSTVFIPAKNDVTPLKTDEPEVPFTRQISASISITLEKKPVLEMAKASSYTVKRKRINEQQMAKLLWNEQYSSITKEKSGQTTYYRSKDGREMACSDWQLTYSTPLYDSLFYMLPFKDELNDMTNYFTSQSDLDFMSRESAIQTAKGIADALDISVLETPRVVALDVGSLNRAQYDLEKSKLWSTERSVNKRKYSKTWKKSEEAYAVVLKPAIGQIPICAYFNINSEQQPQFPTYLMVLVGRGGVAGIESSGLYETISQDIAKPIMDFDEMMDAVVMYYDRFITTNPMHFERAVLQLVPSLDGNTYRLTPMWVLSCEKAFDQLVGTENRSFDEHIFLKHLLVNAYTGEVVDNQ